MAIGATDFDEAALDAHLRANLRLVDTGRDRKAAVVLAESRDLDDLRARFGERASRAFAAHAADGLQQRALTTFPETPIPVSMPGAGGLPAYPALQDDGDSASLAVHADPAEARRLHPQGVRRLLVIALAAGWAGDVALLSDGQRAFLAGLGSFAVGHAAYVVGLRHLRAPGPAVAATGPRLALLGGLALGPLLAQAAGRRDPGLRAPVAAYAALLAGTAASATHLDTAVPREARLLLGAGAWLFLVSDSVLGLRAFVLTGPAPWAERTVMATYTLAQALLVEGTLRT